MIIGDWFELSKRGIQKSIDLRHKADILNKKVIDLINSVGNKMSEQFLKTHKIASDQVEMALKTQSNLIDTQYDVNQFLFPIVLIICPKIYLCIYFESNS
jgi:hypothetical protein